MTVFKDHPDWNELAALTDRGSDGARPELLEHLAACPACLAAWSAAVEARDRELAALDVAAAELPRASSVSRRRSWPQPRRLAWGLGGLAAAALLLFVLIPQQPDSPAPSGPQDRLQHRLGGLSHHGLVYPRVQALGATPITDYRAGLTNGAAIDLSVWSERFAADAADTEAAFWLAAGFLSRGQIDHADDVLRRALRRTPQDRDLRHLAVIAAYQRSDLAAATDTLRAILHTHPGDDLARLNLAVIDQETGGSAEMRAALTAIAADSRQPALQARARLLLDQFEGP
jgi:hypothetical protein